MLLMDVANGETVAVFPGTNCEQDVVYALVDEFAVAVRVHEVEHELAAPVGRDEEVLLAQEGAGRRWRRRWRTAAWRSGAARYCC